MILCDIPRSVPYPVIIREAFANSRWERMECLTARHHVEIEYKSEVSISPSEYRTSCRRDRKCGLPCQRSNSSRCQSIRRQIPDRRISDRKVAETTDFRMPLLLLCLYTFVHAIFLWDLKCRAWVCGVPHCL